MRRPASSRSLDGEIKSVKAPRQDHGSNEYGGHPEAAADRDLC